MSDERIEEIRSDFRKALARLEEALKIENNPDGIVADAVIQRFEFTFELAWKLARQILLHGGIEANTPRSVIKEAFKTSLISDGDGWIDMLEDRNKTAHIYDEHEAAKIFTKIRDRHLALLQQLAKPTD